MRAVLHKGHRRYVTRKGQGHRQSKHTSAQGGKKSRSAGGQLRAFNEEKHRTETLEVLDEWMEELRNVYLIWIVAPGHNRDLFLKHLSELKDKIRFVPITTKRPSLAECTRIAKELTTLSKVNEDFGEVEEDLNDVDEVEDDEEESNESD